MMINDWKKIYQTILFYLKFDKISWIFLIFAVSLNIIIWLIWFLKSPFNIIPVGFTTGVLMLNTLLAFFLKNKETPINNLLLGAALFVQMLFLVLLKYSLFSGF